MNTSEIVWIVDDDKSIRWVIEKALQKIEISTRCFQSPKELLIALQQETPDVVITDIRMPNMNGLELLEIIKSDYPELPVIVMTAHSDLDSAVAAFHSGAFDYLAKPFDIEDLIDLTRRACLHTQQQREATITPTALKQATVSDIIGKAPAMQEVFRAIGRLARSHITVLINGESGTGKELVAKALHRHSPRYGKPFVALNMAAIPKDLMESELFGHEKGAFTGAVQKRIGRFEQANGGTLFLDEIGDMPSILQTRLLRVLADGEFYPVGSYASKKVDVRIIAATHQNLENLVKKNRFRADLFHRLNVIRIHIPSLRERRQDIPLLLRHFLQQAAQELEMEVKILNPDVEEFLSTLDWDGNVRQLENTCRWLTVMASGREIHVHDLPLELSPSNQEIATNNDWKFLLGIEIDKYLQTQKTDVAKKIIAHVERVLIERALVFTSNKRQKAAVLLGYGRNTLARKLNEDLD